MGVCVSGYLRGCVIGCIIGCGEENKDYGLTCAFFRANLSRSSFCFCFRS